MRQRTSPLPVGIFEFQIADESRSVSLMSSPFSSNLSTYLLNRSEFSGGSGVPDSHRRCICRLPRLVCSPRLFSRARGRAYRGPATKRRVVSPPQTPPGLRTPVQHEHTEKPRSLAHLNDPECRVWVQAKRLAELRRCGFTTIQLRRLFYDSQFHESPNRFEVLAEAFDAARRRWWQFVFVLAAGDVEPKRGFGITSGWWYRLATARWVTSPG